MSSQCVVGIDVGSTKISVLVGERTDEGEMRIIGAGQAPASGIKKGVIVDIEEAARSIHAAMAEADDTAITTG